MLLPGIQRGQKCIVKHTEWFGIAALYHKKWEILLRGMTFSGTQWCTLAVVP